MAIKVNNVLLSSSRLALIEAPGLAYSLPREYAARPRLTGRAVVELVLERADGALAFVDSAKGGLSSQALLQITLDGACRV